MEQAPLRFLPFWFSLNGMATDHPLKKYRTDRGLTQEALGGELGVTGVTVSRWETGARKIDDDLVQLIADRTGIRARELRPDLAELMRGECGANEKSNPCLSIQGH